MQMKMSADMWMVPLALCFMSVSAHDEQNKEDFCNQEMCETHQCRASLGSTVLLPCSFTYNNSSVSWNQSGTDLIHLSDKYIEFRDPRDGRVTVYPNQHSEGNYSISIEELKLSDLGCYRCQHRHACVLVELSLEQETLNDMMLLVFICSGIAASIILGVGGYCCKKGTMCSHKSTEYNVNNPAGSGTEGVSPPPQEPTRYPVEQQQGEADSDDLIYENEDYNTSNQPNYVNRDYNNIPGGLHVLRGDPPTQGASVVDPNPNPNQMSFTRGQSQRTKQRFHRELFNRLRQASINRHHYVNQGEIRKQQAMGSQEENNVTGCDYKNPIYNRSTDQLNQL